MENCILNLVVYIILMSLVYNIARYMDNVLGTSITETTRRQINTVRRIVLDNWKRIATFVAKF